jgi:hypothetical protein
MFPCLCHIIGYVLWQVARHYQIITCNEDKRSLCLVIHVSILYLTWFTGMVLCECGMTCNRCVVCITYVYNYDINIILNFHYT